MHTRRTFLASLAVLGAAAALPAHAVGRIVDVQVVDRDGGRILETWRHRGVAYVAGRPGDRYALRLVNRSPGRVLVVLSVDGVNVVSGETAAPDQIGYVLAPHASAEIAGWRKSLTETAAFYFTALPDSYAARTDRPDHVGVIGAAVFRERAQEAPRPARPAAPPIAESRARAADAPRADRAGAGDSAGPAMAAPAPSTRAEVEPQQEQAQQLGTGHGDRAYAPARRTSFERASSEPAEIVQIRYDSRANLAARGVVPAPRPAPLPKPFPEPFPGFVRDPS